MPGFDSTPPHRVEGLRSIYKPAGPRNISNTTAYDEELDALLKTTSEVEDDNARTSDAHLAITKAINTSRVASEKSTESTDQPLESGAQARVAATAAPAVMAAPFAPTVLPVVTDEETAEELVHDYYFPASDVMDDPSIDHVELMDQLESLVQQVKQPDDYLVIRDDYCDISVMLNLRGLWAPAFRPNLPIPLKSADRQQAHTLILRDRIVIDCHWLHAKGGSNRPKEAQWRPLLKSNTPFPFDLSTEFAKRIMAAEYRAEAVLSLTPFQQFQMRTLRGTAVQNRIKAIDHYRRENGSRIPSLLESITLAVNRWCELDRRVLPHREKYLAHARARALLEIEQHTVNEIAELGGMMQGAPTLSESTVRGFLAKLDKRLTSTALG